MGDCWSSASGRGLAAAVFFRANRASILSTFESRRLAGGVQSGAQDIHHFAGHRLGCEVAVFAIPAGGPVQCSGQREGGQANIVDLGRPIANRVFDRSEEHTSELPSLMRISYYVFCLKKKKHHIKETSTIRRVQKEAKNIHNLMIKTIENNRHEDNDS